jgi:hypothetical protein
MTGPTNDSSLPDRFEPITWEGFVKQPNSVVEVEMFDPTNNTWRYLATGYTAPTPITDAAGENWYPWNIRKAPWRFGHLWPPLGTESQAKFRAVIGDQVSARTFTAAQGACVRDKIAAGSGFTAASDACGFEHEVRLKAPCDRLINGGCYDFPTLTQIQDYPSDRSMEFSNGLQGVTNDGTHWYFTSTHRAYVFPFSDEQIARIAKKHVTSDLNNEPTYYGNPYSPTHRHFGDLDHHAGTLYVALEVDDGTGTHNAIGRFRASDLAYYPSMPIPTGSPQRTGGTFPWLARNPYDGRWYSSKHYGANELYMYTILGDTVTYRGAIPLSKTLDKVQGGVFSANGRLYLSTNSKASGAVNVVELIYDSTIYWDPPNRGVVLGVGDLTWDPDSDTEDEIEGITIWNLDDGRAPGVRGQIHVLMIQQEENSNDDWYFKHMRANPIGEL